MVLIGWAIGRPFLMDFEPFAALVLVLSVVHTYFCSSDGSSNWCALPSLWHAGLPLGNVAAFCAGLVHGPR